MEDQANRRTLVVAQAVGLILLTVAVHWRSLEGGFLWDDEILTFRNPLFFNASPWYRIWCTTDATDYYPLTWSLLFLEWRWFGSHAMGYHAVNLGLHVLGVVLAWRVLERLKVPGAWWAALVFSIHPANVATVGWVSQAKSTLALVFYACTAWCYLSYEDESGSPARARRWWALALGFFAAALLSKSSGILLPVALLAFSWWRGRPARGGLALLPFLALSAVMACCTVWFQHHRAMGVEEGLGLALPSRVALGGWVFWFYCLHFLIPHPLVMVYPLHMAVSPPYSVLVSPWGCVDMASVGAWLPSLALVLVAIAIGRARAGWGRPVVPTGAYILCMLLPVLGLVEMSYQKFSVVSDHLAYMANLGLAVLVVGGVSRLPLGPRGMRTVGMVGCALLAALSFRYEGAFLSAERLWRHTLAHHPACWVAHLNLGSILEEQKRLPEAVQAYRSALANARPDRAIWYNLGHALFNQGQLAEAIHCYRESLKVDPGYAEAHNNLGTALELSGARDEAEKEYRLALAAWPDYAEAHNNLGTMLLAQGKLDAAATHLRAALASRPKENPQALATLARVRLQQGDAREAGLLSMQAIQQDAGYADGYRALALVLFEGGKDAQAEAALLKSLSLDPHHPDALWHLGLLAARNGRPRDALRWYGMAAQAAPRDARFVNAQAWLLATSRDVSVRNGTEAVRLARQACAMVGGEKAEYLDTLAAGEAETGNFEAAAALAQVAVDLAQRDGDAGLARAVEARRALYRARRPYRE